MFHQIASVNVNVRHQSHNFIVKGFLFLSHYRFMVLGSFCAVAFLFILEVQFLNQMSLAPMLATEISCYL